MNVLLIPEDFRNDQYILGPLFSGLLALCGKPNANVRVCLDPLLGGVSEAMKPARLLVVRSCCTTILDHFGKCCVTRHEGSNAPLQDVHGWLRHAR